MAIWFIDYSYDKIGDEKVVNDVSKKAVHLTQKYINSLVKDEYQKQYLLQFVSKYRNQFSSAYKSCITKKLKI